MKFTLFEVYFEVVFSIKSTLIIVNICQTENITTNKKLEFATYTTVDLQNKSSAVTI